MASYKSFRTWSRNIRPDYRFGSISRTTPIKIEGIKLGRYLNHIEDYIPLSWKEYGNHARTLQREEFGDVLDRNLFSNLTQIKSLFICHYNTRERINTLENIQDEGVTLFLFFEAQYWIFRAIESEGNERHLFYQLSKFIYRLGCFNIVRITQYKISLTREELIFYMDCLDHENRDEELKTLRAYALREEISGDIKNRNKLFLEIKHIKRILKITGLDYDDLLHEDYLLNFKKESDDILACLQEHKPKKDMVPRYKRALKNFLQAEIWDESELIPTEFEKATWITSSTSYSPLRTLKKELRKYPRKIEDCLGQQFKYERVVIQVSPANTRDAWRADPSTYLQQKYFDNIVQRIIKRHPKSGMTYEEDLSRKLDKLLNDGKCKFMIDFKKAGLTIPHCFIKASCEILEEVFPKIPWTKWSNGIIHQTVQDGEKNIQPKRGFGLGMGNGLMTLVLCILSDVIATDSLIYSDDTVFSVKTFAVAQAIDKFFDDTIDWPLNSKKNILTRKQFVFLEEYHGFEAESFEKIQRSFIAPMEFIFSENIWEIKEKLSNFRKAYTWISEEFYAGIYKFYIDNIGSEFDHELRTCGFEEFLPIELGGWENEEYTGINHILDRIPQMTEYEKLVLQNVLENYDEFNREIFAEYKEKISSPYEKKYWIKLEDKLTCKQKRVYDNYSFESIYRSWDMIYNQQELSSTRTQYLRKLKGKKTSARLKIWNKIDSKYLGSDSLLAKQIIDIFSTKVGKKNFSLPSWLCKGSYIKSNPVPGCLTYTGRDCKPWEKFIAYCYANDIKFTTNYSRDILPSDIEMTDFRELPHEFSVGGWILDENEFDPEVIREASKLNDFPEAALIEAGVKKGRRYLSLSLNLPEYLKEDDKEILPKTIGKGNSVIQISRNTLLRCTKEHKELIEKAPKRALLEIGRVASHEDRVELARYLEYIRIISEVKKERRDQWVESIKDLHEQFIEEYGIANEFFDDEYSDSELSEIGSLYLPPERDDDEYLSPYVEGEWDESSDEDQSFDEQTSE